MVFDFGIAFPGSSKSSSPTMQKSGPGVTSFGPMMKPAMLATAAVGRSTVPMARPAALPLPMSRPAAIASRIAAPAIIKPVVAMTPSKPVSVPPAIAKVSISPTLPPPSLPRSDSEMVQQVQVMKQVDVEQAAALAAVGQQLAALKEFSENLARAHNDTAGQVEQLQASINQVLGAVSSQNETVQGLAANIANELDGLSGQISNQNAAIEELVRGVAGTFSPRKTAQAPVTPVRAGFRPAVRPSVTSAVPVAPQALPPDLESRQAYVPEEDAEFEME